MTDMHHHFEALKDASKERRASNLERSTNLLGEKGVSYVSKNDGNHLIVTGRDELIDFWPSTGKFKQRSSKVYQRGVFNLLKLCEVSA
jgi:hypothetical protein